MNSSENPHYAYTYRYHLCTPDRRLLELEKLKQRILTGTPSEQMEVVDELVASNNEGAAELFIELLESTDPQVRNSVALGIYELKAQTALEPLLTAIFKPENHNYNGTLVYALEQLDCTNKLKDVFSILFYESYEAKMSAYAILDKQIFEFTRTELLEIQAMRNDLLANPEKCPGFISDDTKEMIEVSVEGFMGYLNGKTQMVTDADRAYVLVHSG